MGRLATEVATDQVVRHAGFGPGIEQELDRLGIVPRGETVDLIACRPKPARR